MYNNASSPNLTMVVFSGNNAQIGGGMGNENSSSPLLIGAVFSGNSAPKGGGIGSDSTVMRIVNTIFSGNTGTVPDIEINLSGRVENITIAGSVLGTYLSTGQPSDAIVGTGSGSINKYYRHLSRAAVNLTGTATLTMNGMNFTYPTITAGSSTINLGVYVRRSGNTYYYSDDNTIWYTGFTTAGNWGSTTTFPSDTEDMTAQTLPARPELGDLTQGQMNCSRKEEYSTKS